MARDRRELLDDNGLPIGEYGREHDDGLSKLDRPHLLRKCRELMRRIETLEVERIDFLKHIQELRGEEPGLQEDAPPRQTRRRLRF